MERFYGQDGISRFILYDEDFDLLGVAKSSGREELGGANASLSEKRKSCCLLLLTLP